MADVLNSTARQVRLPNGTIHRLLGEPFITPLGRQYRTVCDRTLAADKGAMLTTREAGCTGCADVGGPTERGQRALVDAILSRLS